MSENPSALVLQFMRDDGPGYLGEWARQQRVELAVVNAAARQPLPRTMGRHRALALLGGAMSANDDLPFLRDAQRLIDECLQRDLPVLGHCLGGQLIARALGAKVAASPAPEVGWHPIRVLPGPQTDAWFGADAGHTVFQWHYEAFELPRGAVALATNEACPVQAFTVGPHLAMQFHVEVDAAKIATWLSEPDATYLAEALRHATIQPIETIRTLTSQALPLQQTLARRIYARWLAAVGFSQ